MALQSEVSPHLVGDSNKDTQIEGDTKSEDDSSQSTDEDVDLEEGEILDSGDEGEEKEKKDLTNSSLQEVVDKNLLKSIEQLVSQCTKTDAPLPITNKAVSPPHTSPHKVKKRSLKYLDHDRFENHSDHEDGWYSPTRKSKSSKYDAKLIDYRKELEAYRGTPPSSPEPKDKKRKRSSKKSKSKKTIKRKDIKGERVRKYIKDSMRHKICKFFKEGNCAKGADCGYSHHSPHFVKKKELCKFYLSGHCNKGNDCVYMHGEFPCKFYHTGSECYAKDACRFSHAKLNDEMRQILNDYLRISHGDDDYDRKRRRSPSPERERERERERKRIEPPPKRTCLLGSPPRHIREAEETKRWQEEMLQHQHDNPAFMIHVGPVGDNISPPPPFPSRPNFYQETLPTSPQRRHNMEPMNNSLPTGFPLHPSSSGPGYETYSRSSPSDNFVYEEDYQDLDDEVINVQPEPTEPPNFGWNDMHGMDHHLPVPHIKPEVEPFAEPTQQELDFTSDVKFDETTQFSEMESSIECRASSPPNTAHEAITIKKEIEEDSNQDVKNEDKIGEDSNSTQEKPVTNPISIPSHLPKKQQELFKRIFQHQKKIEMAASASDASNSPKHYDSAEPAEKETDEDVKEKEKEVEVKVKSEPWYSSEDDDDDDSDEPLTDVLRKLQKEPSVKPPVQSEPKPPTDIMALLSKVTQNTEKNKTAPNPQSEFIKNLLSGKILSNSNLQPLSTSVSEPRRTLLPDPQISIKKEPIVPLVIAPKDPRLKNRDPRTLTANVNNVLTLPKTLEQTILQKSSVITQENKISTFSSTVTSTFSSAVISETVKDDIPYKLRGIYTKPPNYTPYINASQSNPNLLKDPRLRKHMNLNKNNENGIEIKKADVPPIPKLLLAKFDKFEPINIFESTSASKPPAEENQDVKPLRGKLMDPRMKRRDSQNSSGSNTPPHLTAVDTILTSFGKTNNFENDVKIKEEKKRSPPILERAWNAPTVQPTENIVIKQEKVWNAPTVEHAESVVVKEKAWNVLTVEHTGNVVIKQEKVWNTPTVESTENIVVKQEKALNAPAVEHTGNVVIKQEKTLNAPIVDHTDSVVVKQEKTWNASVVEHTENIVLKQEVDSDTDDPLRLEIDESPPAPSKDEDISSDIVKKSTPIPASHLPRAIADPRMARLHGPLDSRRLRIGNLESNSKNTELKRSSPQHENQTDTSKTSPPSNAITEPDVKTRKSIPKKKTNKSDEKKKTVHRNRKSSLDYASPLNSCDDNSSGKSLNYNSYNQRPRRTTRSYTAALESLNSANSATSESTPDFISDNSNLDCDNSSDVNLKDKFKTIDPTASPFC